MAEERVYGPYETPSGKWKLLFRGAGTGRERPQRVVLFETEREAKEYFAAAQRTSSERTLSQAVTAYLEHLQTRQRRPIRESTAATHRVRLVAFLRLERDRPITALTPSVARDMYKRRTEEVRPDTHQNELALASAACRWFVSQGWLAADPFAEVTPVGQKSRGKPQLRLDEARRLVATCLEERSKEGLAVSLALLTGARASEVTDRVVRDLDNNGGLLWVTSAKTRAGVRRLYVPELLRSGLLTLAEGRQPDDLLWGTSRLGAPCDRHWLGHHTRRLCAKAGVPIVGPHSFRGTHAALALEGGEDVERLAKRLGEADSPVLRRHYLAPGAVETERAARVAQMVSDVDSKTGLATPPLTRRSVTTPVKLLSTGDQDGQEPV